MPKPSAYEFQLLQMTGARSTIANERLKQLALEGWEPYLVSGEETLTIVLRRKRDELPPAAVPPASS